MFLLEHTCNKLRDISTSNSSFNVPGGKGRCSINVSHLNSLRGFFISGKLALHAKCVSKKSDRYGHMILLPAKNSGVSVISQWESFLITHIFISMCRRRRVDVAAVSFRVMFSGERKRQNTQKEAISHV